MLRNVSALSQLISFKTSTTTFYDEAAEGLNSSFTGEAEAAEALYKITGFASRFDNNNQWQDDYNNGVTSLRNNPLGQPIPSPHSSPPHSRSSSTHRSPITSRTRSPHDSPFRSSSPSPIHSRNPSPHPSPSLQHRFSPIGSAAASSTSPLPNSRNQQQGLNVQDAAVSLEPHLLVSNPPSQAVCSAPPEQSAFSLIENLLSQAKAKLAAIRLPDSSASPLANPRNQQQRLNVKAAAGAFSFKRRLLSNLRGLAKANSTATRSGFFSRMINVPLTQAISSAPSEQSTFSRVSNLLNNQGSENHTAVCLPSSSASTLANPAFGFILDIEALEKRFPADPLAGLDLSVYGSPHQIPGGSFYKGELHPHTNLPHGLGELRTAAGVLLYSGYFHHGMYHGLGCLRFSDGSAFSGSFYFGDQHGYGVHTRLLDKNGEGYRGHYAYGKRHGEGWWYENRHHFIGHYDNGIRKGQARFVWPYGDKHEGNWDHDRMNGFGTIWFINGMVYEGPFDNGAMHGRGRLIHADGTVEEGEWIKGRRVDRYIIWTGNEKSEAGKLEPGKLDATNVSETCTICYDEYIRDERLRKLPCDHFFHVRCIKDWLRLNASCPICRARIPGFPSATNAAGRGTLQRESSCVTDGSTVRLIPESGRSERVQSSDSVARFVRSSACVSSSAGGANPTNGNTRILKPESSVSKRNVACSLIKSDTSNLASINTNYLQLSGS